jgi:hypothetical protein
LRRKNGCDSDRVAFGEMGLLADRYATANITAAAPPTVYELTKADLKPILEAINIEGADEVM